MAPPPRQRFEHHALEGRVDEDGAHLALLAELLPRGAVVHRHLGQGVVVVVDKQTEEQSD